MSAARSPQRTDPKVAMYGACNRLHHSRKRNLCRNNKIDEIGRSEHLLKTTSPTDLIFRRRKFVLISFFIYDLVSTIANISTVFLGGESTCEKVLIESKIKKCSTARTCSTVSIG